MKFLCYNVPQFPTHGTPAARKYAAMEVEPRERRAIFGEFDQPGMLE